MFAVFVIGSLEAMLQTWRERDQVYVLDRYFAENVSNGEKISSLYDAFRSVDINVDKDVFEDFLAIKYLRNTIIHGRWKPQEKDWLERRGFPTDTRKLTKSHMDRIEHVNQNMMLYIFLTEHVTTASPKPAGLVKLDEALTRRPDESGILSVQDLNRIVWNNLERIDFEIYSAIESTMKTEKYGLQAADVEQSGRDEARRLFYLAARRAGKEGYEPLACHQNNGAVALSFWREYWQRSTNCSTKLQTWRNAVAWTAG
jgi:hypothetical protein